MTPAEKVRLLRAARAKVEQGTFQGIDAAVTSTFPSMADAIEMITAVRSQLPGPAPPEVLAAFDKTIQRLEAG